MPIEGAEARLPAGDRRSPRRVANSPGGAVVRVHLISTVALFREGLAEVLSRRNGIDIEGTGADPDAVPGTPAVILLDVSGFDTAEVAARIVGRTAARVIAVNVPASELDVIACAEAGLACCLTPEASLDDLLKAIASVERDEAPCSPWTAAVLLRRVASLASERRASVVEAGAARLTSRELDIVELVEQGLSNKEIAGELCIELPTVKNHMHRILEKLGVRRRGEAAALVRSGAVGRAVAPKY
ncbi:MAG: LuxR C-terminal-related transcriptional regulator [Thermoleophilaceae bacterium]